jgi:hypothetical protein
MAHLKTFFFLVCCFLVGMGIATAIVKWRGQPARASVSHTGVGNAPALRGFNVPLDAAGQSFTEFGSLHATAVAVEYRPSNLATVVARAHEQGLRVVLLPPHGFSVINPYPSALATIAAQAEAAKVDVLCISWFNTDPDPAYWNPQIAQVRKLFTGRILIASTPDVFPRIEFPEAVDLLGVIGPLPIARRLPHAPDDVDLHALRMAWAATIDTWESFSIKTGKPLVLLNIDIPATLAVKLPLPDKPPPTPTPDQARQLLAYEALLYETKGRQDVEGLFMRWNPNAPYLAQVQTFWSSDNTAGTAAGGQPLATPVEPPPADADTSAPDSPFS